VTGHCAAFQEGTAAQLPIKLRRAQPQRIEARLVLIERSSRVLLWQRPAGARRMAGFWDLPAPEQLSGLQIGPVLATFRHTITHHHYTFTVVSGSIKRVPRSFRWFLRSQLLQIPLSTTARKALRFASGF
jgi:adenine-specific DNA glycosylase